MEHNTPVVRFSSTGFSSVFYLNIRPHLSTHTHSRSLKNHLYVIMPKGTPLAQVSLLNSVPTSPLGVNHRVLNKDLHIYSVK